MVKNTQVIPSVNARNWMLSTAFNNEIITSQDLPSPAALTDPSLSPGMGIKSSSASQRLIFVTNSLQTDIWTPIGAISSNAGLRFLMNPLIVPVGTI